MLLLAKIEHIAKGEVYAALIGGAIGGLVTLFLVLPVKASFSALQKTEVFRRITKLNYVL